MTKPHLANPLPSQDKLERAERMALQKMAEHGYQDPRLVMTIHGSVHDFDKCREYDQKLAYFRHVALTNLGKEVVTNVPRANNDWVQNSYG